MNDADEIVIGANGRVLAAPVGTAAPADVATAFGAAWVETGYINDNGVSFRDSKTMQEINVWQSMYAVRRTVTGRAAQASFGMRQWNKHNLPLAFGGGDVTVVVAGQFKYEPPEPEDIDERALAIEWEDGAKMYRLIIPKGMAVEATEVALARSNPSDLPVTFAVNGSDAAKPWYLLTNDPAFA